MQTVLTWLKAAADPTRVRLLALLARGELTVSEIVEVLDQSQPRVSRHLKLLCDAGLLSRFQEGTWVFYRLARSGDHEDFLRALLAGLEGHDPALSADRAGLDAIRKRRFDQAQAYFREHAATWNEIRALHVPDSEVEQTLEALVGGISDARHLDIGTGTARMLEVFAPHVRAGLGIDVSRDMLAFARSRLDEAGLAHCEVRQGDMYALPVENESQDLVTVHQVLHFADEPARVMAEAARVLAPGGRLAVVDFAPHNDERLRDQHQHRRLGFADAEMARWAQDAGLNPAGIRHLEGGQLAVTLWRFDKQVSFQERKVAS